MRRSSASTKRPPSRLWIGSIRSCSSPRGEWSSTALVLPLRHLSLHNRAEHPQWRGGGQNRRATPASSLSPFSPRWSPISRAARRFLSLPITSRRTRPSGLSNSSRLISNSISHYTPTYSSWLNQVENLFAKIERDVIAAASSPGSKTWPADLNATSVTTIALPSSSSGPTATPHIASVLIPFHLLQATRSFISTRCWTR